MDIFIIIYERPCVTGCSEKEIRLCKTYDKDMAEAIAKEHGRKFFPGWSVSISNVVWSDDDTAFVYFIFD